jgi:hypothetical protein
MTKAEVQKVFEQKAPPKVQEKVLTSEVTDYDEWLDAKALEMYGDEYHMLSRLEQSKLNKMYNDLELTQYDRYKTPGGENYREILLKLPAFDSKRIMELESDIRRIEGSYRDPMSVPDFRAKVDELAQLKEQQAAAGTPYVSSHYKTDPNLLAHIRVQDRVVPTYDTQQALGIGQRIMDAMGNVNGDSINRAITNGLVTPKEAAQYAHYRSIKGVDTTGATQKILHVEEIQSDWHQEGRKKGYKSDPSARHLELQNKIDSGNFVSDDLNELDALRKIEGDIGGSSRVPDAPFKKNWHELAMKRVLDYAAENGYDSIAITPGAEQAKRYSLSKQIDALEWNPEKGRLYAKQKNKSDFDKIADDVTPENLADYIGKEAAEKLIAQPYAGSYKQLNGVELEVGGEGMKGFYDKILPDYLNNFGKQYGASVEQSSIPIGLTEESKRLLNDAYGRGTRADVELAKAQAQQQMHPVHFLNITPQMREQIQTKGQPLYGKVAMPALEGLAAGTGAATIGSEVFDTNNEQQVQNPVHFTENPDAMLLELMQRN